MSPANQEDDRPDRALWRRYRDAAGDPPDSPCPDPNTFGAYVDGRASPEEVARVEEHLAACAACRALLADVRDGLSADPPEVPSDVAAAARAVVTGTKPRGRVVRGAFRRAAWWAAAAAVVAAVSFAGYRLGSDTPGLGDKALSAVDPVSFGGPGI